MGFYKQLKETFQREYSERAPEYRRRMAVWRKQPRVVRSERPTNVARARELGYKAKQGYVIARVRMEKGMRKRKKPDLGRKPSRYGRFYSPERSWQAVAEQKVARAFPNCEVLNSYFVGEDGMTSFFEVILVDRGHGNARALNLSRNRVFTGLTSAAKKSRGLLRKGVGAEKVR